MKKLQPAATQPQHHSNFECASARCELAQALCLRSPLLGLEKPHQDLSHDRWSDQESRFSQSPVRRSPHHLHHQHIGNLCSTSAWRRCRCQSQGRWQPHLGYQAQTPLPRQPQPRQKNQLHPHGQRAMPPISLTFYTMLQKTSYMLNTLLLVF